MWLPINRICGGRGELRGYWGSVAGLRDYLVGGGALRNSLLFKLLMRTTFLCRSTPIMPICGSRR